MSEEATVTNVGFTIDAGLIQRLGYELVGRAETAVSELIKNAYDADATIVDVDFIDSFQKGGTLIISDNGVGMTKTQLVNGFMRISSTDKIHNPTSERFHRTKAGRKGIGRFATQRLGEELTIVTQTKGEDQAIKIVIDWNEYSIDKDLSSITFPIEYIDKEKEEGTILTIKKLREGWTEAAIRRVYRYVLDLFQPNYLSERSKKNYSAIQDEESFKVNFNQTLWGRKEILINEKMAIFDKSLAIIEGVIDEQHKGAILVQSSSLNLDDIITIENNPKKKEKGEEKEEEIEREEEENKGYSKLKDVYFKTYYFIYNRPDYYRGRISKLELSGVNEYAKSASGVRLYRNGFRVLPYGESTDDWLKIDRRHGQVSGSKNIPLANQNLFGFVEITDPEGKIFEETASREGLIENEAFMQLEDFLQKSFIAARQRIAESLLSFKEQENVEDFTEDTDEKQQSTEEKLIELENLVDEINDKDEEQDKSEEEKQDQNTSSEKEKKEERKARRKKLVESIRKELEEASMLRVLAGMGLTIGEFSHEIKQFQPSVYGYISKLREEDLTTNALSLLDGVKLNLNNLIAYTGYFNATVSQNINRETEPIDVLAVLDTFKTTIDNDLKKNKISFVIDEWDFNVLTVPMHRSEWSSILFNLYTNAKKAINRAKSIGEILVEVGIEGNNVFLNFYDNGDGIPLENRLRVFNAFFTTSTPAGFDAPKNDQMVGSGLGLKIVKDILISYKGNISVIEPINGYNACFRIEIPKNK
jgi:signal transduction histidine kinase/anti-sigma regulatory factor (Ser/Thr protein kinase)